MKKRLSRMRFFAIIILVISLIFIILLNVIKIKSKPAADELILGDGAVTISVTAVGDCFIGSDSFDKIFKERGSDYSYCFRNVKEYFDKDDITLINYEGCISDRGTPSEKEFTFRTKPEYIKFLTESSIEAANLSNNHSRDFGDVAFNDTKKHLSDNGIINFVGSETAVTNIEGIKVGLIGTNAMRADEKSNFLTNMKLLKEQNPDLVIASFHWGEELADTPNDEQISLAHTAIDNGADLVIGHHPHVVQGIEKYKDKYILYSLGNFCFGGNKNPTDKDSMIFNQVFVLRDGELLDYDNVTVVPCSVSSVKTHNDYQPTPLSGKEFDRVKEKIIKRSKGFSGVENIYFRGN